MVPLEFFVKNIQPWLPDIIVRWILYVYLTFVVNKLSKLDHPFKELRTVKRIREAGVQAINETKHEEGRFSKVAEETSAANEQHYEVPTEFFQCHLGPLNKYSSCEWDFASNIKEAELNTFNSYMCKMGLAELEGTFQNEGERPRVLEIGCGWGSFVLHAASTYPNLDFVCFSNSSTQIRFIQEEAKRKGLDNVSPLKLDINDFCEPHKRQLIPEFATDGRFHRIISIECLEHSRNYYTCFKAMHDVLREDGRAFLQILCHREYTYFMNKDDWMGRNFFTGGTIPSTKLFQFFNEHLRVADTWYLRGTDYGKTLDAWLDELHVKKDEAMSIFKKNGYEDPSLEYEKWRMFYLMSSASFRFNAGRDWMVAYYLLDKRKM